MIDYKGNPCPVCGKPFAEGDDIVVCPDCGTPHHRQCWAKAGVCANAAKHAPDFEWRPKDADPAPEERVCPNCGTHNPPQAQFCNHCGVPLPTPGTGPAYAPNRQGYTYGQDGQSGQGPIYGQPEAPGYRREIGPDDLVDGIKARDWASYVGRSSLYYLICFVRLSETCRKTCVSFSAFLLGPIYFFYRKMWKQGFLFALLDLFWRIPASLYLLTLSEAPLLAGMNTAWLVPAINVCYLLKWVQMVVQSLFAVYWYKKECTCRIHAIYDRIPEGEQRTSELALSGGTSFWAALLYSGLMTLLGLGLFMMMGPNLNAVFSALM